MATIRELFHTLGNKHNLLTIGTGATQELLQDCIEIAPETIKAKLAECLQNLKIIVIDAKEADRIVTEIHDRIYNVVDPDTGKPKPKNV